MITKQDVIDVVSEYDKKNITIGVLGSHSALDVCDGARDEGIPNLVVCQKGRDGLYTNYFKNRTVNGLQKGFVDETLVLNKFDEILTESVQQQLISQKYAIYPQSVFCSLQRRSASRKRV